ncbi:MAG: GAF domain-containing protein [Calothrix sp. SM1_7_51]|nr:GAF domain-containing protein [Calothrix sp. SM1_7_51]
MVEDIYAAHLDTCHIKLLEKFDVKANLVAPILINNRLYGLLIAHQCNASRKWQESEINLLKAVAIPVGFTLEQAQYLAEQQAHQEAEKINDSNTSKKKSWRIKFAD